MRKAFSFYRSYYEQFQCLELEQIAIIIMTISRVQFLELHIDDVEFDDKMSKLAWAGIQHSLKASIDGYCAKVGIDYDVALGKGLDKPLANKEKEKKKEKGNKEVEEEREEETLPPQAVEIETEAQHVATYLLEKIIEKKANFRKPDIKVWERDIKKALEVDGRSSNELIGCIDWIYSKNGSFWIPVILSGEKLRDKFDVMESQMMSNHKKKSLDITAQVLAKAGY